MPPLFDHEKLRAYQQSIAYVAWCELILERAPKAALHNQLDRAATSVSLNIAEGNGKFTPADRCKFFDIARGSALECAACLEVLVARQLLQPKDVLVGKRLLVEVVSMLVGLIKGTSDDRLFEVPTKYGGND